MKDSALTQALPGAPAGVACGDYAVNTIQPFYQPYAPARRRPPAAAADRRRRSATG